MLSAVVHLATDHPLQMRFVDIFKLANISYISYNINNDGTMCAVYVELEYGEKLFVGSNRKQINQTVLNVIPVNNYSNQRKVPLYSHIPEGCLSKIAGVMPSVFVYAFISPIKKNISGNPFIYVDQIGTDVVIPGGPVLINQSIDDALLSYCQVHGFKKDSIAIECQLAAYEEINETQHRLLIYYHLVTDGEKVNKIKNDDIELAASHRNGQNSWPIINSGTWMSLATFASYPDISVNKSHQFIAGRWQIHLRSSIC